MDKIYLIEIALDRDQRITWSPTLEGIPDAVKKAVARTDWEDPIYVPRGSEPGLYEYGMAAWIADYGNRTPPYYEGPSYFGFTQEPYHVSAALVEPGRHIQVDS